MKTPILGGVVGRSIQASVTFTRPANTTGYTAGDVVSNSASASTLMEFTNFARSKGGSGYITAALLATDKKSIVPAFRLHLFNSASPTRAVDNVAHEELYADLSKVAGPPIDLDAMTTPADTTNSTLSKTSDGTLRTPFKCADDSCSLFVLLETLTDFTPASGESFTLILHADLD